jgi:ricin-type beta-trefoil lectin protein
MLRRWISKGVHMTRALLIAVWLSGSISTGLADFRSAQHQVAHYREIRNVMGRCLDVAGGVNANRTDVQIFECNGTASQLWRLTERSELRNTMGRCLDVAGGVNENRTNVQIFDCNGTASQQWRFEPPRRIRNVMGRCLDVAGGINADRSNVQIFDCNNTNAQRWRWR